MKIVRTKYDTKSKNLRIIICIIQCRFLKIHIANLWYIVSGYKFEKDRNNSNTGTTLLQ